MFLFHRWFSRAFIRSAVCLASRCLIYRVRASEKVYDEILCWARSEEVICLCWCWCCCCSCGGTATRLTHCVLAAKRFRSLRRSRDPIHFPLPQCLFLLFFDVWNRVSCETLRWMRSRSSISHSHNIYLNILIKWNVHKMSKNPYSIQFSTGTGSDCVVVILPHLMRKIQMLSKKKKKRKSYPWKKKNNIRIRMLISLIFWRGNRKSVN